MAHEQLKGMSPEQQKAGAILQALGFKAEKTTPGTPMKYKITSDVIDFLKSQEGKSIVVPSTGGITID